MAVRLGVDAQRLDQSKAVRDCPVCGRVGTRRAPGLVLARHVASGFLPRRCHLLRLGEESGVRPGLSDCEPARRAVSNQVSAAVPGAAVLGLANRSGVSLELAAGHAICLADVSFVCWGSLGGLATLWIRLERTVR